MLSGQPKLSRGHSVWGIRLFMHGVKALKVSSPSAFPHGPPGLPQAPASLQDWTLLFRQKQPTRFFPINLQCLSCRQSPVFSPSLLSSVLPYSLPLFHFFPSFGFIVVRTLNTTPSFLTHFRAYSTVLLSTDKTYSTSLEFISSCLAETPCVLISNSHFPQPLATAVSLSDSMNLTILDPHINGIMQFYFSIIGLFHLA